MRKKINRHYLEACREIHDINPRIVGGYKDHNGSGIAFLTQSIEAVFNDYGLGIDILFIKPVDIRMQLRRMETKTIDIASPDIVPHEMQFSYKGTKFMIIMALPVPRGNIMTMRGSNFTLVRTMKSTVITVENDGTMILDMLKKNIIIENKIYNVYISDVVEIATVPYSPSLHKPSDKGKYRIPIMLYRLLESGIVETLPFKFKIQHKLDPVPEDMVQYAIFENNSMSFIIHADDNTPINKQKLKQILYIVNSLPEETLDIIDVPSLSFEDEYEFWFTCLCLLSSGGKPISFNSADISTHLVGVGTLNERSTFKALGSVGIKVNSFPELMDYISTNYERILSGSKERQNKRLQVEQDLYEPIVTAFTELSTSLVKTGFNNKILPSIFRSKLREGVIFQLVTRESVVRIVRQQNNVFSGIHNVKQNKRSDAPLEAMIPTADDMWLNNINIIPTSTPFVSTLNPYNKNHTGLMKFTEKMQYLENQLKGN